jgi:hypothetical protein
MELVAAVNSVRLAKKVKEALKIPLAGTKILYGFVGGPGHAQDGIRQVHRICRGKSE